VGCDGAARSRRAAIQEQEFIGRIDIASTRAYVTFILDSLSQSKVSDCFTLKA